MSDPQLRIQRLTRENDELRDKLMHAQKVDATSEELGRLRERCMWLEEALDHEGFDLPKRGELHALDPAAEFVVPDDAPTEDD